MNRIEQSKAQSPRNQEEPGLALPENPLDTAFFDGHEHEPIVPHAPPKPAFTHWLSVDQIRRMQRMRRQTVIDAMNSGELPFEKRGRIRYARLADVQMWEEKRLSHDYGTSTRRIAPELEDLAR